MEKTFFNQPIKFNIKTYVNIRKITTGQEDDYTTGCLLDENNFKNVCIWNDSNRFNEQQKLDVDPKAIQRFNFTGYLSW